ncbi:MAG TPA: hypothetical protein VF662_12575 [Allosphingosinicella sp.]
MSIRLVGSVLVLALGASAAPAQVADPVSARTSTFCKQRQSCIQKQRAGVQQFLKAITLNPRPSQARVQWCLGRATDKKNLTDWAKAARCIR